MWIAALKEFEASLQRQLDVSFHCLDIRNIGSITSVCIKIAIGARHGAFAMAQDDVSAAF